jgi:hypothetical protein
MLKQKQNTREKAVLRVWMTQRFSCSLSVYLTKPIRRALFAGCHVPKMGVSNSYPRSLSIPNRITARKKEPTSRYV